MNEQPHPTGDRRGAGDVQRIEISAESELEATLQRISRAAQEMTAARFGGVRMWDTDDTGSCAAQAGVRSATVDPLGPLLARTAWLAPLRQGAAAVRSADIAPQSAGAHEPGDGAPLCAFLAVPIHVGGEPFGSLYLADDRPGVEFTDADEVAARAVASIASVAIDNAHLTDSLRAGARWSDAEREITAAVLTDDDPYLHPLELIVRRGCELTHAEQGLILVPAEQDWRDVVPDTLVVSAAFGRQNEVLVGQEIPIEGSTTGAVFRSGEAVITEALRHPIPAFTDAGPRPAVVVPLNADSQCLGVLVLARRTSGQPFDTRCLDAVRNFANHAAIALTMARARSAAAELRILADRERIAHDLHDQVIQRVFAVGMDLQGVRARTRSPELCDRLSSSIDELQAVISEIRSTIFDLQSNTAQPEALAERARRIFHRMTEDRNVIATLTLSGPMERVTASLVDDAEAVVLEGLSNALRHAAAAAITVDIAVDDGLSITITDDGEGISADVRRRSGLANLARRARSAGGDFVIDVPLCGGTRLTWSAPLSGAEASHIDEGRTASD